MSKISITEIVRYIFSGFVVIVAFGISNHINVSQVICWIENNPWISGFSPVLIGTGILFLVGYYSFLIYRNIGYDVIMLSIKYLLTKIPHIGKSFYSYRELIHENIENKSLTIWECERLYRVLRRKLGPEFYDDFFSGISAGLHLLYFTAFVFLITFIIIGNIWAIVYSLIALFIVIGFDCHFERQELLIFLSQQEKLRSELKLFRDHPAWE